MTRRYWGGSLLFLAAFTVLSDYTIKKWPEIELVYSILSFISLIAGVVGFTFNHRRATIILLMFHLVVLGSTTFWLHREDSYLHFALSLALCMPLLCFSLGFNRLAYWGFGINTAAYLVTGAIPIWYSNPSILGESYQEWFNSSFCVVTLILLIFFVRQRRALHKQVCSNRYHHWHWQQSMKRCRELFYYSSGIAFLCDIDGNVLHANSQARDLVKQEPLFKSRLAELFQTLPKVRLYSPKGVLLPSDNHSSYRLKVEQLEHHHGLLVQCLTDDSDGIGSYIDPVTGFSVYRQWIMDYPHYQASEYALAVIKVGDLRSLNIRKSNAMGDWLLRSTAKRLQQRLDPQTHFYRFRGARILLMAPVESDAPVAWAEHLLAVLNESRQLPDGEQAKIYWQIGITQMRTEASALELLDECDLALKQLSAESSWSIYHVSYRSGLLQYCQQQDRVLNALNEQHLELYLQPQTLANGVVVGYECLARLFDESGTLLPPDQFMAYVEEQNSYAQLAKLVFRQATEMLLHWPSQAPCVPISINLAGPELLDDDFYSGLKSRYQQSELLRRRLAIELTETSIFSHHQQTQQRLNELSQLGVSISIDDFGTGHASLAQLVDISVVALKIDQLFVSRVIDSEKHASIIRASIELARSLGLKVVAEGVETEEQLNALTALGCQIFQGFFFGRPMPLNQLQAPYSSL